MGNNAVKLILAVFILVQCGLIAFGTWLVQQPNAFVQGAGWFSIVVNIAFGVINVKTFLDA